MKFKLIITALIMLFVSNYSEALSYRRVEFHGSPFRCQIIQKTDDGITFNIDDSRFKIWVPFEFFKSKGVESMRELMLSKDIMVHLCFFSVKNRDNALYHCEYDDKEFTFFIQEASRIGYLGIKITKALDKDAKELKEPDGNQSANG